MEGPHEIKKYKPPHFWEINNILNFFKRMVLSKGCESLLIWSDYLWVFLKLVEMWCLDLGATYLFLE